MIFLIHDQNARVVVLCWAGLLSALDRHVYVILSPRFVNDQAGFLRSFPKTSLVDFENSLPNDVTLHGKMWSLVAPLFSPLSLCLSLSLHVRLDWVGHLNGEAVCLRSSLRSTHCVMYAGPFNYRYNLCSVIVNVPGQRGRAEHYRKYGLILHQWNINLTPQWLRIVIQVTIVSVNSFAL